MRGRGKRVTRLAAMGVVCLVIACVWLIQADNHLAEPVKAAVASDLHFTKKTAQLKAGEKYRFQARGTEAEEAIKWSVSDRRRATIRTNGTFVGKRAGTVCVTASVGAARVQCKVRITGKKKVAIDPGHQLRSNAGTEPVGPGSSTKKMKVTGGTSGVATRVAEYQLNLDIAKKLKKELLDRGYEVYMIRTKNNVNLSNKKRAKMANKSGADIYIRLHADSSTSASVRGASALYPSTSNPYVKKLSKASKKLSRKVLSAYCSKTGIKNRGIVVRDDLTGTNWSKIPVTLIEMGFMSNAAEDRFMQKKASQQKMAAGLADGIDAYFGY